MDIVEFKRPVGMPVTDDEIVKVVNGHYDAALAERSVAETKWQISDVIMNGFWNFGANWNTRQVYFNPSDPKGSMRTKIPELLTRTRREKGRCLGVMRVPSCRPRVTGTPNVWRANRFAQGAINYLYDVTRFDTVFDDFLDHLLME